MQRDKSLRVAFSHGAITIVVPIFIQGHLPPLLRNLCIQLRGREQLLMGFSGEVAKSVCGVQGVNVAGEGGLLAVLAWFGGFGDFA